MFTRNFIIILLGNVILGSAMPMLIILGGLAGAWLAPQSWLATAPPSAQMLAGIIVASPISLFMGRFGRRAGFLLGGGALVVGGGLAVLALQVQSFVLLCVAHLMLGAALICVNYFRFAASEAVSEDHRPQAISVTLASGLVAALLGPELYSLAKEALAPTPFAGAYMAVAALGAIGILPILGLHMPVNRESGTRRNGVRFRDIAREKPIALTAIGIAALSQAIMVLLMVPTPLAMAGCGFDDDLASDVIRWHVVAMFAPGFFTGSLIKAYGAGRIAALGVTILVFSAVVAALGLELLNFYLSLILLGIGWNFGFVSGTHLLQSVLSARERPVVQGANDTILAISASVASLFAGTLYAGIGWIGLAAATVPVLLVLSLMLLGRQVRPA